jgi:LysR family glycine cleavage system transcriptional activator
MRRRLPPLKTLEGFDAAARLGSFSAAAEALGLTQSAISHQIRLLEEALGQPLFRRLHRKIVLTDAGQDFQRSVNATLVSLRDGVNRLEPYRKPGSVIVYCDAALANAWLSPRLTALRHAHPQIDLWLDTSSRPVDFEHDEVDILIRRHSDERLPGQAVSLRDTVLFREELRPLAAPALARRLGKGHLLDRLPATTLLHEEGFDGWPVWLAALASDPVLGQRSRQHRERGEPPAWLMRGPNFSDAYVMLQAAAGGLGIALATPAIADPFIAEGRLSWISATTIAAPGPYIATATEAGLQDVDIVTAYEWICREAAGPRNR